MESQRVTGAVLIAGVLAMILGVAAHSHHGPVGTSDDEVRRNLVVAVIVVGSYGTLAVGFSRLLRSMTPRLWSDAAGVAMAFAGICGAVAAVAGHVVVPRLLGQAGGGDSTQGHANPVVVSDMILSLTLAQTSFVAWAIGVVFLSIAILHGSAGWKIVGAGGMVLGLLILTALALGRLEFSMHNVGLVALGSGIWIGSIGVGLCANQTFLGLMPQSEGN